jgi:hypothetical protein
MTNDNKQQTRQLTYKAKENLRRKAVVERLDSGLPRGTRCCWVNDRVRQIWEPRILRIRKSWKEIERLSVAERLRTGCLTVMSAEELVFFENKYPELIPVQSNSCELNKNVNDVWWMIVRHDGIQQLKEAAWSYKKLGMFLGYPSCCCDFFEKKMNENFIDTWYRALNTIGSKVCSNLIEIVCAPEANTLLHAIGLKAVPHVPCSFSCDGTIRNGVEFMNIGNKFGFSNEMRWLKEILSWPVEWSTLQDIEEIKTPLFEIMARTTYAPKKYVVRRKSDISPYTYL